jgi:HD superfamily phosphodiesterase
MINWKLLNEKIKLHMNHESCGHGFDHVERVSLIAQKLMKMMFLSGINI